MSWKSFVVAVATVFAGTSIADAQVALTINNHSFEADTPTGSPGYRSSVTGWTMSAGNFGTNTAGMPFMDNGTIPDGTRVLFLQQPVSATQSVAGFLAFQPYTLRLRVNSRSVVVPAVLKVSVGGNEIVPPTTIPVVGGTNPFQLITKKFQVTTAGAHDLRIENTLGPADNTLLVDQVEIVPAAATASDWQLLH